MSKNKQWASKLGFIMATAGAAIGLGNLWKFPYLMGKNGGFPFLVAYLFFIVLLGLPVMITEMSLGRKTRHDPVQAYADIHPHARIVGIFGVLAAFIILSYYSVIGGWILKYIASYVTTAAAPDFDAFIGSSEPVIWHIVFMAATIAVCYFGINGIEKASKLMMPMLLVLLFVIIFRSVTLPGASKGLLFIFQPDFSAFTLSSVSAALGQVFYSLSLCMGITITYGSYLSGKENIPKSCMIIGGLDTVIAVLAGIAIFPAVFAFGLEPGQGPGLIFGTLPMVFASFAIDSLGWERKPAALVIGTAITLLGIPSALSFGVLSDVTILNQSVFDFAGLVTDNILMPLGGLTMCYYVGWKWKPEYLLAEIEADGTKFRLGKLWVFCIRFLTPIMVGIVSVTGFYNLYLAIR